MRIRGRVCGLSALTALGVIVIVGASAGAPRGSAASASPTWRALPPAPISGRLEASTVWTGKDMIVWGGVSRSARGQAATRSDGAAYDPATRRWRRIAGAPRGVLGDGGPAAAWTGRRMVVFVGNSPDGPAAAALYDPRSNTWNRLSAGPLGVREQYASVWTGRELLIFGGHGGDRYAMPTAAALNPATGTWRRLPALDSIVGLGVVNGAVWTGRVAFVAGQLYRPPSRVTRGILFDFDPTTNRLRHIDLLKAPLTSLQRLQLRPVGASGRTIVFWAGTGVVRYDTATGRWSKAKPAPCNPQGQVAWAGGRLLTACGAERVQIYSARGGGWSTIRAGRSPFNSRDSSQIVWTGSQLIVWSGEAKQPNNPTPPNGASLTLSRARAKAAAATPARLVYERAFRTGHPTVWIARADGSHAHRLASGLNPRISPDGRLVTYIASPISAAARLMLIPASGGRPRLLASDSLTFALAWSPDSRRIAVAEQTKATSRRQATIRLVTIDVASGRRHVIGVPSLPYSMSFSPDSRQLAYTASDSANAVHHNIYLVPAAGGHRTRVTSDGHSMTPVWGPGQIVFARASAPAPIDRIPKQILYLVKPSGADLHRLTHRPIGKGMFGFTPLAWSANGRRLIAEFNGMGVNYVATVDPVTGTARAVGRRANVGGAGLSRDGSTILGVQAIRRTNGENIVTLPYQGGPVRVLARDAVSPSWSR